MSSAEMMGELRSLLHEPPPDARLKILALFERWPSIQELTEVALPYCLSQLERLPQDDKIPIPQKQLDRLYEHPNPQQLARMVAHVALCPNIVIQPHSAHRNPSAHRKPGYQPKRMPTMPKPLAWRMLTIKRMSILGDFVPWLYELELPHLKFLALEEWGDKKVDALEHAQQAAYELAQLPWLANIERLRVTDTSLNLNREVLIALMQEHKLPRLTSLNLSDYRLLDPELLRIIFHSPCAANITEIDINDCYISSEGLAQIISSPTLKRVERFDIRFNWDLSEDDITALTQAPWFHADIQESYDTIWE